MNIVMGRGNLGTSLSKIFDVQCEYKKNAYQIHEKYGDSEENWIWVTEGFGSVPDCKVNPEGAFDLHVKKTFDMINMFPKSNLVFFSTNYVNHTVHEKPSLYAITKKLLESVVINSNKENVYAIRVANLYSTERPSFFSKVLDNKEKIDSMPDNIMIPTDTDWLARKLMAFKYRFKDHKIIEIAPSSIITTNALGEMILQKELGLSFDHERPFNALIENTFSIKESWEEVFNESSLRKKLKLNKIVKEESYRGNGYYIATESSNA